jgi:DNA-damage-inducible protein J
MIYNIGGDIMARYIKKSSLINVCIDSQTKERVELLFSSLGLDLSSAIKIFINQSLICGDIPFNIKDIPNADTLKAMQETDEIQQSKKSRFNNINEMFKKLGI